MTDPEKQVLARVIRRTPSGTDLDRMIGMVLFNMKIEHCNITPEGYHLVGAVHYASAVASHAACSLPLPRFSVEWGYSKDAAEWITTRFAGLDFAYDCGRWHCNINSTDKQGRWFRLSHISGALGMQEALWKAALLAVINPQNLPLAYRPRLASTPMPRKIKPKKRRKL